MQFPTYSRNTVDVRRIATDVVMRVSSTLYDSEILTMGLVSQSSSIRVPAIRRVIERKPRDSPGIVMDYIPGETLGKCWARLSWWQRLRVTWTLRSYVRQLRRIQVPDTQRTSMFPGPLASEPQECAGCMFTELVCSLC